MVLRLNPGQLRLLLLVALVQSGEIQLDAQYEVLLLFELLLDEGHLLTLPLSKVFFLTFQTLLIMGFGGLLMLELFKEGLVLIIKTFKL